ncbi:PKD domain protein [Luteitalea pratensis]|uniref:PKD domain protein n=1 Tax=Luteitalea pratensis TaxID=1855912 RepID=A0A143PI09_LUTPR|nr:PKD domain-containing protein [Luteitalea pratensis]AMY08141.1 PKD domain protein [Luteitalea pratensis]
MRTLLPLIASGALLSAVLVGCESKNPVGPGEVTVVSATTTTTTVVPARRYVAFTPAPTVPSDMTLFFELVSAGTTPGSERYTVFGLFKTGDGSAGEANGQLTGSPDNGQFAGRLTLTVSGCTAEREFSGPLNSQLLRWTGGTTLRDCPGSPLNFPELLLLKSDLPPPTTTAVPTPPEPPAATTTIAADLRTPDFVVSPSGAGLLAATVFSFQYMEPPTGGTPPFTFSWNFGDGIAGGTGTATTHVFNNTGRFVVTATITDSKGVMAQDKVEVQVGAVTGAWNVAVQTSDNRLGLSSGAFRFPTVLSQTQSQVVATVTDPTLVLSRQGLGNASNPRLLSVVGLELGLVGSPTRVNLSFVGDLDSTLRTWTGTATGFADCPCPFTATR